MSFPLVPKSMTLNDVMALILRYFTEFGSFWGLLRKSCWRHTDTFCDCREKCQCVFKHFESSYATSQSR